jgi:hypothetical protein
LVYLINCYLVLGFLEEKFDAKSWLGVLQFCPGRTSCMLTGSTETPWRE